jgi:hypothetical protein
MYARIATWEGAEAGALRANAEDMNSRASEGPPAGVPAVGFTMLIDPDSGRSMAIGLFETEEDMRKGDETLNAMNPSGPDVGKRTAVDFYEVAVDVRA